MDNSRQLLGLEGGAIGASLGGLAAFHGLHRTLPTFRSPLAKRVIEKAISKLKIPPISSIQATPLLIRSHYNPLFKSIVYGRSAPIFFHELGHHALISKLPKKYRIPYVFLSRKLVGPLAFASGFLLEDKMSPLTAAAIASIPGIPMFIDELLAHIKGYRIAKALRREFPQLEKHVSPSKFVRIAAPALATYLAIPVVGSVSGMIGHKFLKDIIGPRK